MVRIMTERKATMSVKPADQVAQDPVPAGVATTRQMLIGPDEGPHFAMRRFIMQPGGGIPVHTNTVEHEQYVLRGRAAMTIGDEPVEVKAGDVVFIPAGTPHSYQVLGAEPFEFLCVVPNLPDRMELLERSKE
jgi:quercetin dioxygenase-like cupin family protein